jgi:hypothetical protein
VDEKFYFGLNLPVEGESITRALCLVRDDGESFVVTPEELASRRLYLKYMPPVMPTDRGWSLEKVRDFVSGTTCTTCTTILDDIQAEMRKYIELYCDDREYTLVALWIIGTYLQPIWISYPYIGVSGAKRTGKSKLLKFIEMLAFNAMFSTDISTPTLYRLIQSTRCTVLMDEAEALSDPQRKTELKNILYSGYKKYGFVYRSGKTAKEQIVPEKYETFSPKVFVTYRGLEEILNDRSISIVMVRTNNPIIADTEINETDPIWANLRDKLYVFALKNWKKIREIYTSFEPIEGIHSRDLELWKPILVLAKFFGEDVFEKMKNLALKNIQEKEMQEETETRETLLLLALIEIVEKDGFYAITDIQKRVSEMFNEEFTVDWIGRTLSDKFGFKETMRLSKPGRPRARRLTVQRIRELAIRYGIKPDKSPEKDVQVVQVEQEEEHGDGELFLRARDLWNMAFPEEKIISVLMDSCKISKEKATEVVNKVKEQYKNRENLI